MADDACGREAAGRVIHYLADSSALWRILRDPAILHDDNDFATAAGHLTDLRERWVQQLP